MTCRFLTLFVNKIQKLQKKKKEKKKRLLLDPIRENMQCCDFFGALNRGTEFANLKTKMHQASSCPRTSSHKTTIQFIFTQGSRSSYIQSGLSSFPKHGLHA